MKLGNRVAVLSDLHLSDRDLVLGTVGSAYGIMPVRLLDKIQIFEKVLIAANSEECTSLVITGDIFDSATPSELVRSLFYRTLKLFDKPIVILIGNHDYKNTQEYNFKADNELIDLVQGSNVRFVTKPDWIDGFCFVPHCPPEQLLFAVENFRKLQLPDTYQRILFGHQMVQGSQLTASRKAKESDLGTISAQVFHGFAMAFFGDVHKASTFGNIVNVGSLYINNHGEEGNQSGFVILNRRTAPATQSIVSWSWLHVSDREWVTFEIDCNKDLDSQLLRMVINTNSVVRVKLCGKKEDIVLIDKRSLVKHIKDKGAVSVSFEHEYLQSDQVILVNAGERFSLTDAWLALCKARDIDEDICKLGLELLGQSE